MAKYRYTVRRLDELTDPSKARPLYQTMILLQSRLKKSSQAPDRLAYNEEVGREHKSHREALGRVRELMRNAKGPERIVIRTDVGPDYAIRKIKLEVNRPPPAIDGAGTSQIDVIHAATLKFCAGKGWPVVELGICVDKPGEHGHCNAWDGGCQREGGDLLPADEIHRRCTEVWKFLRAEGVKHQNGNGGLPVNGCIVMSQYWERGMGPNDARFYSGTPHVSHWHVSGWPSRTGWV